MGTNHADIRNRKFTLNMLVLCICYIICSFPHMIYGYTENRDGQNGDHIYLVTLGIYWGQYCLNIFIYILQRDQYWNAYKDFLQEQILPIFFITKQSVRNKDFELSTSKKQSEIPKNKCSDLDQNGKIMPNFET